jgi:adenine-specific DNA-methyltransferase
MTTKQLQPRKALNKAYLKVKPNRKDIERFKENLIKLFNEINAVESEEYHKNSVSRFLENTYYAGAHYINTKGRKDLVIHNGKDAKTSVGVILEAKKPTNKAEMPGTGKNGLNTKAMQELLLYYLRERVAGKNLEIKHLIITNCHEWFIFDANVFEKWFAGKRSLIKDFEDFEAGRLAGKQTDFFYKEIAEKAIAEADGIEYTYFDLRDYEKIVRNEDLKDDQKLIVLFKLLSPEHLLKLPFANDSNSLDKGFYSELLHIIGLKEEKDGGKKIIRRCKPDERLSGSLLENTILQLDTLDKISRLDNPAQYGATYDERLFTVGLELVITWVNRILFLKLLEAQLIAYHKGDKTYAFLNSDKVRNLDDLNTLFFQVLAKRYEDRNKAVLERFERVPYLNSSLFEMTDIEHTCFAIGQLDAEEQLPVLSSTVLRDDTGKKITGTRNTLDYFFAFLNSYDFAGEGSEDIQEDNKTLINASVLGLIFEKINGYKDGSFFTPGFITMYMCRETIRKAVVQKFNEAISSKPEGAALPPLEGDKGDASSLSRGGGYS